jgi:hypothetical protein
MRLFAPTPSMPTPTIPEFAAVVKRLTAGRSLRTLARQTGVSHTRIGQMGGGLVPTFRLLERFANALGLSPAERRELFLTAGYPAPDEDPASFASPERLSQGIAMLILKYPDQEQLTVRGFGGLGRLTEAQVDQLLQALEADILAEQEEERHQEAVRRRRVDAE